MASQDVQNITGMKPHILMASLSYMGILVLIPIFAGATGHPFVKFHVKQGLVILVGEILAIIITFWLSYVGGLLFLLMLIASIAGLLRSTQEQKWYIPGIGAVAELFDL